MEGKGDNGGFPLHLTIAESGKKKRKSRDRHPLSSQTGWKRERSIPYSFLEGGREGERGNDLGMEARHPPISLLPWRKKGGGKMKIVDGLKNAFSGKKGPACSSSIMKREAGKSARRVKAGRGICFMTSRLKRVEEIDI